MSKVKGVKGSLYKRGNVWWVGWTYRKESGEVVRNQRSTGIPVGVGKEEQAENRAKAEAVQRDLTAPYSAAAEADVRAALVARQRDAEEVAAEKMAAAMERQNRIPLDETVWERWPYKVSQKTRGRKKVHSLSPRNVEENKTAWDKFVVWCNLTHGQGNARLPTAPRRGRPRRQDGESPATASPSLGPAAQARADKADGLRFHGLYLQDVTPDWAREYSRHLLASGLTPQRHNKLLTTAAVMFRIVGEANPDAHLSNPFQGVDKEDDLEAEHREPFTVEQVARMIDAAPGWTGSRVWNGREWRGFLATLYFTGLRRADAVLLQHENRRRAGAVRTISLVARKTRKRITITEHPMLTAILDEVATGKHGYLFPNLAAEYRRNPAVVSQRFRTFMRSILGSLEADGEGEAEWVPFEGTAERTQGGVKRVSRFGLHSFRHSFATHCAAANVPIRQVQEWLGHSSEEITKIYTHAAAQEGQAQIVEALALPLAGFSQRLALPAAEAETEAAATAATAEREVEILRRALGEMVEALRKATAANWKKKHEQALAVAARAERECKA